MKVLLINGSPRPAGCTYTALAEVAKGLAEYGIETEFYQIGRQPISGCLGCGACGKLKKCVIQDTVNDFTELAAQADGFIFGSPVYYFGMNGTLKCLMDRAFFSSGAKDPHPFRFKPAAAITSGRRAGTTTTLEQMNKYFLHQQMPVITSQYLNMVHGNTPEEVRQDEEGLQIMRTLGRNMGWFLSLRQAGEKAGIPLPRQEERIGTNFIR